VTGSRRRFTVVVPDWGQGCLSSEAVAAYVDNELAAGPRQRADAHLTQCRECAAQVRAQGQASSALSSAGGPCMSSSLMSALRSIPQEAELPGPPTGLAMTPDGQVVEVLRAERFPQPTHPDLPDAPQPPQHSNHRMRIGAGVAVSGLAIGALAFGASSLLSFTPAISAQQNPAQAGVLGGPVLGGPVVGTASSLDARLSFGSRSELEQRLEQVAHSYLIHP
jgi:anti-sigma factor RsiW